MTSRLKGVIAAIATPITADGKPDRRRFATRATRLLEEGCDGLNVLGTTGEATSFTVAQRAHLMTAAAKSLPVSRMMVGTGATALGDAAQLTRLAADLGFAGALVLPPFYYKPVSDDGVVAYIGALVDASSHAGTPIYLYNFPALSGVPYTVELVTTLVERFGTRIAGLKDSSGQLAYARSIAEISPDLDVFPSNEANLALSGARGPFAGCISATANVNSALLGAAWRNADESVLAKAVAIRGLFDGLPLVPAIKALVGHIESDVEYGRTLPPLMSLDDQHRADLIGRYEDVMRTTIAPTAGAVA
jgi:4-hydroxy-tetrahydrodipicolinate synthase